MRIALDFDGPVGNLHPAWYGRYNRDYNDDLTPERVLSWDTHLYVKPECGMKIYSYLSDPTLYDDVPPFEGALEGIKYLRSIGHEILFVTACTKNMTDQKAEWLWRYNVTISPRKGGQLPDDLCAIRDKTWIDADLLIDDGLHNVKDWITQKRRRAILAPQFQHNADAPDMPSMFSSWLQRAHTWEGIIKLVEKM